MRKISASNFKRLFNICVDDEFDDFILKKDNKGKHRLWLVDRTADIRSGLLFVEEEAVLGDHPDGDPSQPILEFPCSLDDLIARFMVFYGVGCYCDESYLDHLIGSDGDELANAYKDAHDALKEDGYKDFVKNLMEENTHNKDVVAAILAERFPKLRKSKIGILVGIGGAPFDSPKESKTWRAYRAKVNRSILKGKEKLNTPVK